MVQNIFKYAAENALRFPYRGVITTEDLFDLSLAELDGVYRTLKSQVKKDEESLIGDKTSEDEILEVKIAIVTEIFNDKKKAIDAAAIAAAKKMEKQKILEIINRKQDQTLENMSVEELTAKLEALDE